MSDLEELEKKLNEMYADFFFVGVDVCDEATCIYSYGDGEASTMNLTRFRRLMGEVETRKTCLILGEIQEEEIEDDDG